MNKEDLYKKALQLYVGDNIVEKLDRLGEAALEPDGEVKKLTIYLQDIASISSVMKSIDPVELIDVVGEYLDTSTRLITEHEGIIDTYIGDAIMAYWDNSNEGQQESLACKCAIECQKAIKQLTRISEYVDLSKLSVNIGISTGDVMIGNMGNNQRLKYTILGDEVNLASRVQGLNRYYNTNILVTGSTVDPIQDQLPFRKIDTVNVKGKTDPVNLFTID